MRKNISGDESGRDYKDVAPKGLHSQAKGPDSDDALESALPPTKQVLYHFKYTG